MRTVGCGQPAGSLRARTWWHRRRGHRRRVRCRDVASIVGACVGSSRRRQPAHQLGRHAVGRACVRSTPRRRRRSASTRAGLYYCFGCQRRRRRDHVRARDRAPRLRRRGGVAGRQGRHHAALHRRAARAGTASAAPSWWTPWARPWSGTTTACSTAPDAGPARGYLRSRGFDGDVARRYQHRLGARRLGRTWRRACVYPTTCSGHRPRLREPRRPPAGHLPGPGHVPDLRRRRATPWPSAGGSCRAADRRSTRTRPRRAMYAKCRTLYGLNWAKADIVAAERGHRVRGLHRRDRLPPGRRAPRRGHVRHRPHRRARAPAQALRPPHRARLRRRRRRPGRGGPLLRVGEAHEVEVRVAALPAGRRPGRPGPGRPGRARRPPSSCAKPFLGFRVERVLGAGQARHARGAGRGPAEAALAVIAEHPDAIVRGTTPARSPAAAACRRPSSSRALERRGAGRASRAAAARAAPDESAEVVALRAARAPAGPTSPPARRGAVRRRASTCAAFRRSRRRATATSRTAIELADPAAGRAAHALAVERRSRGRRRADALLPSRSPRGSRADSRTARAGDLAGSPSDGRCKLLVETAGRPRCRAGRRRSSC